MAINNTVDLGSGFINFDLDKIRERIATIRRQTASQINATDE